MAADMSDFSLLIEFLNLGKGGKEKGEGKKKASLQFKGIYP